MSDSELKLDKLISFEKSILGNTLNFPRLCLTDELRIAYRELSFSNLTSVLVGCTLISIESSGISKKIKYPGLYSGLINPS